MIDQIWNIETVTTCCCLLMLLFFNSVLWNVVLYSVTLESERGESISYRRQGLQMSGDLLHRRHRLPDNNRCKSASWKSEQAVGRRRARNVHKGWQFCCHLSHRSGCTNESCSLGNHLSHWLHVLWAKKKQQQLVRLILIHRMVVRSQAIWNRFQTVYFHKLSPSNNYSNHSRV